MTNSIDEAARLERQSRFWGKEGQDRISATRVGVVGCGGTGSHVVQQLSYLGLSDFVLVDNDEIDKTSRNRVVGSFPHHVVSQTRKVQVASELIRAVNPLAMVEAIDASVVSKTALRALESRDFIFACVDREAVRADINKFCNAFEIDFVDIATEIHPDNTASYGGRVLFSIGGEMCLLCTGMLDHQEIRRELMSDKELEAEATVYGVSFEYLSDSGPSVIALNGIVASVAVFEWALETSGVRKARRSLVYHGLTGIVAIDTDPPQQDCIVCKSGRGSRGQGGLNLLAA